MGPKFQKKVLLIRAEGWCHSVCCVVVIFFPLPYHFGLGCSDGKLFGLTPNFLKSLLLLGSEGALNPNEPFIIKATKHFKQIGKLFFFILFSTVGWMPFIMIKSLFVCGILGGKQNKRKNIGSFFALIFSHALVWFDPVLLAPAKCDNIIVCTEEDGDLRVDCQINSQRSGTDSYEFSWSIGKKQLVINTNVSGSTADSQYIGKSEVTYENPGYRMTLKGFSDNISPNTTFFCKVSENSARISLGKGRWILPRGTWTFAGQLCKSFFLSFVPILLLSPAEQILPCSAVSVFLQSCCSWIVYLMLFSQLLG